jgi:hypothetical protein
VEVKRSRVKKRKIDAIFDSLMKGVKGDGTSIISATERLIDLAGKKSLTLEIEEDGSIPLNKNKEALDEIRDTGTAA